MPSAATAAKTDEQPHYLLSRRTFSSLISTATTATVVAASNLPQSALAATSTDDIALRASLRSLKLCQRKLSTLQDMLLMQDYSAFKAALRAEPFSMLRKSSSTIVRWTEENSTDAGTVRQIQEQYKMMIRSLEGVDTLATLAMRGKRMDDTEVSNSYLLFSQALDSFVRMSPQIAAASEVV